MGTGTGSLAMHEVTRHSRCRPDGMSSDPDRIRTLHPVVQSFYMERGPDCRNPWMRCELLRLQHIIDSQMHVLYVARFRQNSKKE